MTTFDCFGGQNTKMNIQPGSGLTTENRSRYYIL